MSADHTVEPPHQPPGGAPDTASAGASYDPTDDITCVLRDLQRNLDLIRTPECACFLAPAVGLPTACMRAFLDLQVMRDEALHHFDLRAFCQRHETWLAEAGFLAPEERAYLEAFDGKLVAYSRLNPDDEGEENQDELRQRARYILVQLGFMLRILYEVFAGDTAQLSYYFPLAARALARGLPRSPDSPFGSLLHRHKQRLSPGTRRYKQRLRDPFAEPHYERFFVELSTQLRTLAHLAVRTDSRGPMTIQDLASTTVEDRERLVAQLSDILVSGLACPPHERSPLHAGLVGTASFEPDTYAPFEDGMRGFYRWLLAETPDSLGLPPKTYWTTVNQTLVNLHLDDGEREQEVSRLVSAGLSRLNLAREKQEAKRDVLDEAWAALRRAPLEIYMRRSMHEPELRAV